MSTPLAVQVYPHLKPYYDHEFPWHVIKALVVAAMETMGVFAPEPLALTRDGVWTFGVSGDKTLQVCDREMRANPERVGRWLVERYCTG